MDQSLKRLGRITCLDFTSSYTPVTVLLSKAEIIEITVRRIFSFLKNNWFQSSILVERAYSYYQH